MSEVWGVLGQFLPAATTLTDAYTVPASKRSTIEAVICNRAGATTVRLSHAIGGAADATKQYLLYDYALGANDTLTTARLTASAADVIRVYSNSGSVAFNINGIEEDM